jgi:peptidoglycan/LPS O-acetylase OafA/YrhL
MQRAAPPAGHSRFAVMDGLRGVAALAVVVCHSWPDGGPVKNGPLAVDFFVLLSGFVIAHAYEDELRAAMAVRAFMRRRLIRLYPLVLLGACGGFLLALIHAVTHPAAAPLPAVASSGLLSLVLVPYLGPALGDPIFSFNPPLWSLSFELLANFIYALLARRLSMLGLVLIVLAGLAGTVWGGPLGGGGKSTLLRGLPRVACGFFGGVLLHRLHRAGSLPRVTGQFSLLAPGLLAALCCPWVISGGMVVPVYLLFGLIIAGAAAAAPGRLDRLCLTLGVVSYPLYVLHWLSLMAFGSLAVRLGMGPILPLSLALCHIVLATSGAYAVAHWYDSPLRRHLTRHWQGTAHTPHTSGLTLTGKANI